MGSGTGSFLKVLLENFDVLAGYAFPSSCCIYLFQGLLKLRTSKASFFLALIICWEYYFATEIVENLKVGCLYLSLFFSFGTKKLFKDKTLIGLLIFYIYSVLFYFNFFLNLTSNLNNFQACD
jgi:hypothetical protein